QCEVYGLCLGVHPVPVHDRSDERVFDLDVRPDPCHTSIIHVKCMDCVESGWPAHTAVATLSSSAPLGHRQPPRHLINPRMAIGLSDSSASKSLRALHSEGTLKLQTVLPEGLLFQPEFVSEAEERDLLAAIEQIEFREIRMHGMVARRTTAHFGLDYDYETFKLSLAEPPPPALDPLRARSAALVGVRPEELEETLVQRYPPGASIGWHRDAPAFGAVIGVSLLSACRMRFRRGSAQARQVAALDLPP